MYPARFLVLALLFGCLVTSPVMAKKPSLRSVKNLFVKHGAGFASKEVTPVVTQGGLTWQAHTTSVYKQHGWDVYLSLQESDVQNYLENFHTLTPSAYHKATVLFDDDGVFRSGLATSGESDDTTVILFPNSQKHQTIHISQIVGVQYMHTGKRIVYMSRQDMLPFGYAPGMYESDPYAFRHLVLYRGELIAGFTNGMGIVELSVSERALAEVDKNLSAPAR